MAAFIIMPKLGMTMETGVLTKWLKKEGDKVEKGEPLFELETDKLNTVVEATESGVLRKILVPEGTEVAILKEVGVIGGAEEDISALAGGASALVEKGEAAPEAEKTAVPVPASQRSDRRIIASPRAKVVARELGIDIAKVPAGEKGRVTERDVRNYRPADGPKTSPLVEKMAADLGIDLRLLKKGGRIMAADLARALRDTQCRCAVQEAVREERRAMNGMRRAISHNMLASHMTSPTVTYDISVDMANMQDYRAQLMAGGLKVSYTDLLVKFVAKALTEFPVLNCCLEGDEIIFKHYINMGVAVALDDGLVVPNITNTDQKSLAEISAELKELSTAARNGTLGMDRMREGTFTITNLGMFGIESFSPIINQPEVAILGVNTMKDEFVIRDGEQSIRPIMKLSLTADHRVVDGAVAARFLQRVKQLLELPALMLV